MPRHGVRVRPDLTQPVPGRERDARSPPPASTPPPPPTGRAPIGAMNLSAFHSIGLWLAVIASPPAAWWNSTASWTVGVGTTPDVDDVAPDRLQAGDARLGETLGPTPGCRVPPRLAAGAFSASARRPRTKSGRKPGDHFGRQRLADATADPGHADHEPVGHSEAEISVSPRGLESPSSRNGDRHAADPGYHRRKRQLAVGSPFASAIAPSATATRKARTTSGSNCVPQHRSTRRPPPSSVEASTTPVGAAAGHRVERVRHRRDPRLERDLRARRARRACRGRRTARGATARCGAPAGIRRGSATGSATPPRGAS